MESIIESLAKRRHNQVVYIDHEKGMYALIGGDELLAIMAANQLMATHRKLIGKCRRKH